MAKICTVYQWVQPKNGLISRHYLDTLTDDMLYEKPENCPYTRLELVLRQFRHLSFHTGMLNGQTAEHVGKFPIYVSEDSIFPEDGSLFGRYVTKKK